MKSQVFLQGFWSEQMNEFSLMDSGEDEVEAGLQGIHELISGHVKFEMVTRCPSGE